MILNNDSSLQHCCIPEASQLEIKTTEESWQTGTPDNKMPNSGSIAWIQKHIPSNEHASHLQD